LFTGVWISEPSRPATLAGPVAAFALVLSRAFDGFIFDVTLRLRPARGDAYETRNCTVTQGAETTLAGECEVNGMTSELTGTVKDMDLRFSITVSGYTLTYTGKMRGDSVAGDIEVAGASGTFSGKRAKG
jgi:hypothetical protein